MPFVLNSDAVHNDVVEFEEFCKKSKVVLVPITNKGKEPPRGNRKDVNWTLEYANSIKKGHEVARYMVDLRDSPYFALDVDLKTLDDVGEDYFKHLQKDQPIFYSCIYCKGTTKGYHCVFKKQDLWNCDGIPTITDVNEKWDIDFITRCLYVDPDSSFFEGFDEWELDELKKVFDDGLPKASLLKAVVVTDGSVYTRIKEDVDEDALSEFLNTKIFGADYGNWSAEFEDSKIILSHNSLRCITQPEHVHNKENHSVLYFNAGERLVAHCYSHGNRSIRPPIAMLRELKTILGIETVKDKMQKACAEARDEQIAKEKEAVCKEIISKMEKAGVPTEAEAKKLFEKQVAYVSSRHRFLRQKVLPSGRVKNDFVSDKDMKIDFANFYFQGWDDFRQCPKKQQYYQHWVGDETRREYTFASFIPPYAEQIDVEDTINLYVPMDMEYVTEYEEMEEAWENFQYLVWLLSGEDDDMRDYLIYWLAFTIKYCGRKAGVCPVFISGEGCGKGTLVKLLEAMMGEDKVLETDSPQRTIWGNFNADLEKSLLVCVNEVTRKDMMDKHKLYDKITGLNVNINIKGVESYQAKSYSNYMVCTNDPDPIPTSEGQRRFVFFKCSQRMKKGPNGENTEFWKRLHDMANDKNAMKTIYNRLMNLPDLNENTFPDKPKPVTAYEKELNESNKASEVLFIEEILTHTSFLQHKDMAITKTDLYERYKDFCHRVGVEFPVKQQKLSLLIKNMNLSWFKEGTKIRGVRRWDINLEAGRKENDIDVGTVEPLMEVSDFD